MIGACEVGKRKSPPVALFLDTDSMLYSRDKPGGLVMLDASKLGQPIGEAEF